MPITFSATNKVDSPSFKPATYSDQYAPVFKKIKMEGDLAYEYNPFHNLQDDSGELKDFTTTSLGFDLKHPVDITVQPSYDGTVNLILNDDKNPPRLINSRFTVLEDKKYKRIDRKGVNDTNIYKEKYIDINTRHFKTTNKIPYLKFNGLSSGGNLQSGNYSFYFKYADADTNESDFICETGQIPVYVGNINDPKSIRGGVYNEYTDKIINLTIYNLDESYEYLNIYYTRKTSNINGDIIETAYKLSGSKQINGQELSLSINGFENTEEVALDEINNEYNIVDKVKTQAQVQNTLFFANVDKQEVPYTELADLSLRILPSTVNDNNNIGKLDHDYEPVMLDDLSKKYGYYDAKNVYDYTGYWEKEIYRFGIFYIMKNDTLSPVFDIRGIDKLNSNSLSLYTSFDLKDHTTQDRKYVTYDDDFFINTQTLENVKGVVRILHDQQVLDKDGKNGINPVGIKFHIPSDVIGELNKYIKGFCFVRQKRIPTILAQGVSIGIDNSSHLPLIYAQQYSESGPSYITESFLNNEREVVHDFNSRILKSKSSSTKMSAFLCPESLFKLKDFSSIFTGNNFNVSKTKLNISNKYFINNIDEPRHFYFNEYQKLSSSPTEIINNVKLTLIEDNMPTKYSGTKYFSSRAGIAEEVKRFNFIGDQDKTASARNIVRGVYTGYVGMEGLNTDGGIYDIHTPGYNVENMKDYFTIRFNSLNPYYSISDRYDIELLDSTLQKYDNYQKSQYSGKDYYDLTCYRGDCYIQNVTMRIQRNFQDPDLPINDEILNTKTWKTNYKGYLANGSLDIDNIAKINRSDINAVRIGHWVTFMICSNINLCYRTIDETNSNEYALTGNPKSFYPLSTLNIRGSGKIADSYLYNSGYNSSLNYKAYQIVPDVPYINTIFSNRIMYSDISVDNSFKNGYRVFQGLTYKDITSQYGSIVKITELQGALIIVFENGVGMLPVNERTLITSGDGGDVYIESPNVINKVIRVLSSNYGCSFVEGIYTTPDYVYGIDTDAKKIWRANLNGFEVISEFKIQKFLNDNITLSERDKYIDLTKLNVKIHYNMFKHDVIFVFYNNYGTENESKFAITFNEQLNKFVSFNDWYPFFSDYINNIYFSTDLEKCLESIKKSNEYTQRCSLNENLTIDSITKTFREWYPTISDYVDKIYVYRHGQAGIFDPTNGKPQPCMWYDKQHKFEFEFIVADNPSFHKIYDNLHIISNNAEPDSFTFEVVGDQYEFDKEIIASQKSVENGYNIVKKEVEENGEKILHYETTVTKDNVITYQKGIKIDKNTRRRIGNMQYLEDQWRVEIKPSRFNKMSEIKNPDIITSGLLFQSKESRIRDKYCKIRISYTGNKLSVISAVNTLYSQSFA